jgi:Putative beta-barrel porin-2, OmpL-like. bbp2
MTTFMSALALTGAALADSLVTPTLNGPLAANPNPYSFEAQPLGRIYVSGVVSGFAWAQSDPVPGDRGAGTDLSNAQLFIQKTDGLLQFYLQAGGYSLPALGGQYWHLTNFSSARDNFYGLVPVAYLKLAPTPELSVVAGKLPSLVGAESTFTFQNMNVERGLLWNQEPAISRGVQVNWIKGSWSASLSLNDGFYSGRLSWLSGSAGYALSPKDSLTVVAAGNFKETAKASPATPLLQDNGQVVNAIWTHTDGPLTVTPYLQYTRVSKNVGLGIEAEASTFSGAVLTRYTFTKVFSLALRGAYLRARGTENLLFGPQSQAFTLTLTPTWQSGRYFVRAETSYVKAFHSMPGSVFGVTFTATSQTRGIIETGVLF